MYNITNRTVLLVIDVQNEYFSENCNLYTPNAQKCKDNLVNLINKCKEKGIAVIYIQHLHKKDGSNVGRMGDFDPTAIFIENTEGAEILQSLPRNQEDTIIRKNRYSSFVGTNLHEHLQNKNIDTIIISGLMTNYCCLSTAFSASDLDYKTILVIDAVQGPDMPDLGYGELTQAQIKNTVATTLLGGVADVTTTEELIKQMS